ncbi:MAG: RNA 2',3'-cyclic phosphodiesterase [Gemmataceae bacterium]|nr:RNA 2',3'-cyclic phosphodiesterase [Gemmataceae bacterium]
MARVRTFVAVEVGRAVRARCLALQSSLRREVPGAHLAKAEPMHVTLAFLGDVEDRDLHAVCKAVDAGCAGHDAFALSLAGLGCFPNPERPRTLWAGTGEGTEELKALQADVEAALVRTGLHRAEDRPWSPHLTLARVKEPEGVKEALEAHAGWQGGEWDVGEVLVLSSTLAREGPEYAVLSRAKLRA